ncbi:hypothetical protein ABZV41_34845 [Streptomyces sp. NPDC005098]|uniref:hypothetical protein n=1 Tax=Streptomyces sp. NPDC005098 TaxID=3154560 RepID=UPI0033AE66BD
MIRLIWRNSRSLAAASQHTPHARLSPMGKGVPPTPPQLGSHHPQRAQPAVPQTSKKGDRPQFPMFAALVPLAFGAAMYLAVHQIYMLLFCLMTPVMLLGYWTSRIREGERKAPDLKGAMLKAQRRLGGGLGEIAEVAKASKKPEEPATARIQVSPAARWLTGPGSHVLPAGDRARYEEEQGSELWFLAVEERASRRRQLAHALRVLSRLWATRRAFLYERRRTAGGG